MITLLTASFSLGSSWFLVLSKTERLGALYVAPTVTHNEYKCHEMCNVNSDCTATGHDQGSHLEIIFKNKSQGNLLYQKWESHHLGAPL